MQCNFLKKVTLGDTMSTFITKVTQIVNTLLQTVNNVTVYVYSRDVSMISKNEFEYTCRK